MRPTTAVQEMTVSLPTVLAERLRALVPPRKRSAFIAEALEGKLTLAEQAQALEEAAGIPIELRTSKAPEFYRMACRFAEQARDARPISDRKAHPKVDDSLEDLRSLFAPESYDEPEPTQEEIEYTTVAVLLAFLCLEAYINEYISDKVSQPTRDLLLEKRASIELKWLLAPQLAAGQTFEKGREPFQRFTWLKRKRDQLVHFRSKWQKPVREGQRLQSRESQKLALNWETANKAAETPRVMIERLHEMDGSQTPEWLEPGTASRC